MIKCPKCNQELPDQTKFCRYCGCNLAEVNAPSAVAAASVQNPYYAAQQQNTYGYGNTEAVKSPIDKVKEIFNKVPKKFLIAGVAVILVLVILISIISTAGSKKNNFALYVKDGELFFSDFSGDPMQVTDDLDNSYPSAQITKDQKTIFYLDDGGKLYYRSLKNAKKDPEKLASDVKSFSVSENGKLVIYRSDSGDLYEHNLKDGEKIAKDVEDVVISTDCKKIFYINDEDDLYFKKSGKDAEKITSEVNSIDANEDLSVLYFQKEDDIFIKKGNKDAVQVSSDVSNVVSTIYDSGEMYFVKASEDDDGESTNSLYYYDGKKETLISENYSECERYSFDKPILIYSELDSSDDDAENTYFVAIKDKATQIKVEDIVNFKISENNKNIYFVSLNETKDDDEDNEDDEDYDDYDNYNDYDDRETTYTLYKAAISGSKVKEAKVVDSEVDSSSFTIVNNNKVAYFKDEDTLYINGTKIDDDVFDLYYSEDNKALYYKSDVSSKSGTYTLSKTTGKKADKIADDVKDYQVTPGGKVYYIADYSTKSGEGSLYLAKGKKHKKIDEDVSKLLPVHNYSGSDSF